MNSTGGVISRRSSRNDLSIRRDALVLLRFLGGEPTDGDIGIPIFRNVMDVVTVWNLAKPLIPIREEHLSHQGAEKQEENDPRHPFAPAPRGTVFVS